MKKTIVWVLVLCVALLSLTGCKGKKPEKTDAVRNVESQIDALGEITEESSKAITAALLAYNALTDEEKPLVENYNKLKEAQSRLAEIRAQERADAAALADLNKTNQKIADIISYTTHKNTDSSVSYTELIATGSEILRRYEAASEEDKAQLNVTDEFRTALESMKTFAGKAEKVAVEYVKGFYTVNEGKTAKVTGVYCIIYEVTDSRSDARIQYYIPALTYDDADGKQRECYAGARVQESITAEVFVKNADVIYAAKSKSEDFNAIRHANVELDTDAVLLAAGH